MYGELMTRTKNPSFNNFVDDLWPYDDPFGQLDCVMKTVKKISTDLSNKELVRLLEFRYHSKKTDDGLLYEIELPGVKKESVSVKLNDTNLTVDYTDRYGNPQQRRIALSVTSDAVSASMQDGLLTIKLGKPKPSERTVKIE